MRVVYIIPLVLFLLERIPVTSEWEGVSVGTRNGLDDLDKKKMVVPAGIRILNPPVHSLATMPTTLSVLPNVIEYQTVIYELFRNNSLSKWVTYLSNSQEQSICEQLIVANLIKQLL
jgi:hypothetical protein